MKSAVLLALSVFSTSAQVINIDTFNDGDFTQTDTTAEFTYTGASMAGGEMTLSRGRIPAKVKAESKVRDCRKTRRFLTCAFPQGITRLFINPYTISV
jgi:hypothetical protein